MESQTFTPGARVRFTRGPLGLLEAENDHRFAAETANIGDEGDYVGPHVNGELAAQGWHVVRVELEAAGATVVRFAPVHTSQFAAA